MQEKTNTTEDKKILLKKWAIHTVLWLLAMFVVINCFKYFVQINFIPSASMEPTLKEGDVVLCTRYDVKSIKRYDIVTFEAPDDSAQIYIKRVIGLPGDEVVVNNGTVEVNGKKTKDNFVKSMEDTEGDGVYKVPEGEYFVMGDNRDDSFDSRFWENHFIKLEDMKAIAKVNIYPLSRISKLF